MQHWTVGILCYNEAGTIEKVIRDTDEVLKKISGNDFEIIVVDDFSSDDSQNILQGLHSEFPDLIIIRHPRNLGIGAALRSIYSRATKENVVAICGDGQYDVNELMAKPEFAKNQFLSFYRLQNTQYNGFRNFLSFFNKWFNKYLLRIFLNDVNWVKAYKSEQINHLDLQIESSLVESEICSKLIHAGVRPLQFESQYLPRTYGVSKGSSLKIVLLAIRDLFRLFVVVKRFNINKIKKFKKAVLDPKAV